MKELDLFQSNCEWYAEEPDLLIQEMGLAESESIFERCVLCGQPIPKERLRQLPWAATCAVCKPKRDQALKLFLAA